VGWREQRTAAEPVGTVVEMAGWSGFSVAVAAVAVVAVVASIAVVGLAVVGAISVFAAIVVVTAVVAYLVVANSAPYFVESRSVEAVVPASVVVAVSTERWYWSV